jgi:flagellar basal body rod protein FlgG
MFLNAAMSAALDRITERAADVRRAFTPGSIPQHDDVATPGASSDFTLDPLSVSAPEGAYFITTDERGRVAYTRDGAFALYDGKLVDERGRAVRGVSAPGGEPGELRVDAVDASLRRISDPRIERDGTFSYRREVIDPRSDLHESRRVAVGRVTLARFPAGTKLAGEEGDELKAPPDVAPQVGVPGDGRFGVVAPMQRERSRVDIDVSLIRLKDAYMQFDALQAAEAAKGHLSKTTMDLVK